MDQEKWSFMPRMEESRKRSYNRLESTTLKRLGTAGPKKLNQPRQLQTAAPISSQDTFPTSSISALPPQRGWFCHPCPYIYREAHQRGSLWLPDVWKLHSWADRIHLPDDLSQGASERAMRWRLSGGLRGGPFSALHMASDLRAGRQAWAPRPAPGNQRSARW